MYENTERFVLSRNVARNIYTEARNQRKITYILIILHILSSLGLKNDIIF